MRLPFNKDSLASLPTAPGVYIFLDRRGGPLYVGKAHDLRSRVRSYFGSGDSRAVSRLLGESAAGLDYVVTGSEKEALILENSLIKKHRPRLNIRLKDDKTYFSLRLDRREQWPRLTIVRRRRGEDVLYFGPYTSARSCRRTIQYLSRLFPLRTCPDAVLYNRTRPCISYEIGHCVAPCVDLVERSHYLEIVDRLVRFLSGQDQAVLQEIEQEMAQAAGRLEFERAAELRDRLRHMRATLESPRVARRGGPDRDVVGVYEAEDEVTLTVLHVRDGQLVSSATYQVRRLGEMDELLAAFLGQFYGPNRPPPAEIILPRECADLALHRQILEEIRRAAVEIRVPERGEGLRLLRLAEQNAEYQGRRSREEGDRDQEALDALQRLAGLIHRPEKMEGYDISHLGGEQVVGSRVSFLLGRPCKAEYRHYRLREVRRNDDFAAMEEVLRRRLKRGLKEGDLPDLIVIDGGRAQLNRVTAVMRQLRVDSVDVMAMAKARTGQGLSTLARHERVFLVDREVPLVLPGAAPETRLLQRLRDEAHRFAITYSRRLRGKEKIGSVLELIPGVGRRRAQTLLDRFGSVSGVKRASVDELTAVPGVSRRLAESVAHWFADHARG